MSFRTYIASLESNTDVLFSRNYEMEVERNEGEGPDAFERRTWRHKAHVNSKGLVMIPPAMFKKALDSAAELLSMPIPHRHPKKYTPLIKSNILVPSPIVLDLRPEDLLPRWIFVWSNPARRSSRVWKCYPMAESWRGDLTVVVTSEDLPEEIVQKHLETAGLARGVGSFAARSGGWHGSFRITDWVEVKMSEPQRKAA